ncbi:MAG: FN3 associated domain-containing protein [bacterium]
MITSLDDLVDGEYVVGSAASSLLEATVVMSSDRGGTYFNGVNMTFSDGSIALTDDTSNDIYRWTIKKEGNYFTIQSVATDVYVGYSSSGGNSSYALDDATTDYALWTVTYSSSRFVFTNVGTDTRVLQYYTTSPRFACYTSSQQNLFLYKKVEVATDPYAVTFVDGITTTSLTETAVGGGVTTPANTLSTVCAEQGWKFAGWSTTQLEEETTTTPTIETDGLNIYYPTSDITLYAVYQQGDDIPATTFGDSASEEWTVDDSSGSSYWKLFKDDYMQTPAFTSTYVESITIQMGTFGTVSGYSAVLQVVNDSEVLATATAENSTQSTSYTIEINETLSGTLVFSSQSTSTSAGLRVLSITVNTKTLYSPGPSCTEIITVETPTFSVEGGDITKDTSVEIYCETEDATIYYTTDDNVELSATTGTEYQNVAISIDKTTTLRAIAVKDGVSSSIATATYNYLTLTTIAEFIAAADTENEMTLNDVTVVYQNGTNTWIQDETGSLLIYGSLGDDVVNGDVITGLKGIYAEYNDVHELVNPSYTSVETGGNEVDPESVEIVDITTDDINKYITISGTVTADVSLANGKSTFYIKDAGDNTMTLYTNFSNIEMELLAGDAIDVVGVVYYYSSAICIYPISIERKTSTVACSVTFVDSDTEITSTESSASAGVSPPAGTVSDECGEQGWFFSGWSTEQLTEETTTVPIIIIDASDEYYYPYIDRTFYAVYQQGDDIPATSFSSQSDEWTVNAGIASAGTYWTICSGNSFTSPSFEPTFIESVTVQMGTYNGTSGNSAVLQVVNGTDVIATETATSTAQATAYTIEINQTLSGTLAFSSQSTDDKGLRILSITINYADPIYSPEATSCSSYTQLPSPTGLSVSDLLSDCTVDLSWDWQLDDNNSALSGDETMSYLVTLYFADGELLATYTATQKTANISDLESETSYIVTVQAVAQLNSKYYLDSEATEFSFTTSEFTTVDIPVISTEVDNFTEVTTLMITATEGATIYYTTNGDTPTTESDVFTSLTNIVITERTTISAFAAQEYNKNSAVVTEEVTIKPVGDVVFDEDFSGFDIVTSESTNYADDTDELDTYMQESGWSGNNVYKQDGGIRMGTTSIQGWIETPEIDLSDNGGVYYVEFLAANWSGGANTMYLIINDETTTVDLYYNGAYTESDLTKYVCRFENGTATTTIKFQAIQSSYARFILDNLKVYQKVTKAIDEETDASNIDSGSNIEVSDNATLICSDDATFNIVTLQSGAKLSIAEGTKFIANTLVLNVTGDTNSAEIDYTDGDLVANLQIARTFNSDRYYFVSLPYDCNVADITDAEGNSLVLYDGSNGASADIDVVYYDGEVRATNPDGVLNGTASSWASLASDGVMKAGVGYNLMVANDNMTLYFPEVSTSDIDQATSSSVETYDAKYDDNEGWNLISHSQLSSFSGTSFSGSGAVSYVSYFNGSTYDQLDVADATLLPFVPFFVQVGTFGTVSYVATTSVYTAPALAQAATTEKFKFTIASYDDATIADVTTMVVSDKYTTDYEIGADLSKMLTKGTAYPQIYSSYGDTQYAFNAMPSSAISTTNLGVYLPSAATYTLSLNQDNEAYESIYLVDNTMGMRHNLINGDYIFTTDAAVNDAARFSIEISYVATETVTTENSDYMIYTSNGAINIENLCGSGSVNVYDVAGRLITCQTVTSSSFNVLSLPAGVYMVAIADGVSISSYKVVIR